MLYMEKLLTLEALYIAKIKSNLNTKGVLLLFTTTTTKKLLSQVSLSTYINLDYLQTLLL